METEVEPTSAIEKSRYFNRMDEAFGILCLSISPELLFHVESCSTPNEVWKILERLFGKQDEIWQSFLFSLGHTNEERSVKFDEDISHAPLDEADSASADTEETRSLTDDQDSNLSPATGGKSVSSYASSLLADQAELERKGSRINVISSENIHSTSCHEEKSCKKLTSSQYKSVVPQPNGRWGAQVYETHRRSIKKVQDRIKTRRPKSDGMICTGRRPWLEVSMRHSEHKRSHRFEVDLSHLTDIVWVDRERMLIKCEPMVCMSEVSAAVLPLGMAPQVFPELDDLTVGGVINGYGIKGSSPLFGLFSDTCVPYELMLKFYVGNLNLCGGPGLKSCSDVVPQNNHHGKNSDHKIILIVVPIDSALLASAVTGLLFEWWRRRHRINLSKGPSEEETGTFSLWPSLSGERNILAEILEATENFNDKYCIGIGGFAIIYKALGINYGQVANNLPSPAIAVQLMKGINVGYVKIYDADSQVLTALTNTSLPLVITVANEDIPNIASGSSNADQWVQKNVLPYYPTTQIFMIMVGNEVLSNTQIQSTSSQLVPAMENLQASLVKLNLDDSIKVTTFVAMDALASSYPPSNGSFKADIAESIMQPMLSFLNRTDSYFFVDTYSYFAWSSNPVNISLNYVLFGVSTTEILDGQLQYSNMLDYACGAGADCSAIQAGNACYQPNTVEAHASYAFNSYWQSTKSNGGTCYFNGVAALTTSDPSFQGCSFPFQ